MYKIKTLLAISLLGLSFFFLVPSPAHASVLDDVVNNIKSTVQDGVDKVKSLFDKEEKKELTVEATIELAPDGDVDKNGEIDSGDTVRFAYVITNNSENNYKFLSLKTNIDVKMLNFIHNTVGITSMKDDGKDLIIPYINIDTNQVKTISFDASINYFTKQDLVISSLAEIRSENNQLLTKSEKKQVNIKKLDREKLKSKSEIMLLPSERVE